MTMFGDIERTEAEEIMIRFKVSAHHSSGWTEKYHKKSEPGLSVSGQDSNWGRFEYEPEMLQ
jgi:hypothetical protein